MNVPAAMITGCSYPGMSHGSGTTCESTAAACWIPCTKAIKCSAQVNWTACIKSVLSPFQCGRVVKPSCSNMAAAKNRPFHRLSDQMRSEEQPLVDRSCRSQHRAYFPADARRGQPVRRQLHSISLAGDITSRGCQASARIFNQRSGDEIDPCFGGSIVSVNSP